MPHERTTQQLMHATTDIFLAPIDKTALRHSFWGELFKFNLLFFKTGFFCLIWRKNKPWMFQKVISDCINASKLYFDKKSNEQLTNEPNEL